MASFLWRALARYGPRGVEAYQAYHLRACLKAARRAPFYRQLFTTHRVHIEDIRHPGDLHHLGFFTTSADLRRDPRQFLAVPASRIARTITTAGTTGAPKSIFFTVKDWERLIRIVAMGMERNGVTRRDVVQILYCFAESDWVVGPLLECAFKQLHIETIPAGNALPIEQQIDLMRRHGTTVLMGTPSYLHRLTEEAQKLIDLQSLHIRRMFLGAEAWSECFRIYLQKAWGARVYDSYGMTEMGLAGAAECQVQNGLHTSPYLIFEVIDPESSANLPPGREGELVITTLNRQAMPLLRYRTGDIATLLPEAPCACGIPTRRISRIKGRSDDMVCLGTGENLYPSDVEKALIGLQAVLGYQIIIGKQGYKDTLLAMIETDTPSQALADAVVEHLYQGLGFLEHDVYQSQTIAPPQVQFVAPGTLRADSPLKIRHIVDRRRAPVDVEMPGA